MTTTLVPPTVDLATLASGSVLHHLSDALVWNDDRTDYLSVARCGAKGLRGHVEDGVDARAIRVRGRRVCEKCRTLTLTEQVQPDDTDDRATTDDLSASADGRSGESRRPHEGGKMPEQTKRKRASSSRSAPTRARSTTAAAPPAEKTETGEQIRAALFKALKDAIGTFEAVEPKAKNRTRLVAPGARGAFCYVHKPSKNGVTVQIVKALKHVKAGLAKDSPFIEQEWGLTFTLRSKKDIPAAVKGLKIAAAASQPDEDAPTTRESS